MIKCPTNSFLLASNVFWGGFFCFLCSELNRNRIRQVEGLTFQGLSSLEVLKLQRNSISKLTDGAFWDLAKMKALYVRKSRRGLAPAASRVFPPYVRSQPARWSPAATWTTTAWRR